MRAALTGLGGLEKTKLGGGVLRDMRQVEAMRWMGETMFHYIYEAVCPYDPESECQETEDPPLSAVCDSHGQGPDWEIERESHS